MNEDGTLKGCSFILHTYLLKHERNLIYTNIVLLISIHKTLLLTFAYNI